MPNHTVFISTLMASWDVDSYRIAGVANTVMDNGTVVNLGAMGLATTATARQNTIGGYEYVVTAAADATGKLYIVDTPLPGATVEMQVMEDPRYFYNEVGRPLSLRKLVDGDHIELTAPGFAADPVNDAVGTEKYTVAAGKFSKDSAGKFVLVAKKTIAIGVEDVASYILRYDA